MYIHNFAREDSKGAFVELSDFSFDIGKILINFVKYDENTHKTEFTIPIYLDFKEYFALVEEVRSGRIYRRISEEKSKGNMYANVNQILSGDSAEKARTKKYPFEVPNGKAVSKSFSFSVSKKSGYLLKASLGLGREDEKGLIIPGVQYKYIEVHSQGDSYVYNNVIYTLNKGRFTGVDFEGKTLYERILDTEDFKMTGVKDKIFLMNNKKVIILDDENHLIKEMDGEGEIDGISPIVKGFAIFSRDSENYKTTIYDDDLNILKTYVQKDATIDVSILDDAFEVLNIKKTEEGLSSVLNRIKDDETETVLELGGYVPYKFYNTKDGYLIATDKELVFYDGKNIEGKISYEGFRGLYKLQKNYCLFADNILYVLKPNMEIVVKEELSGFDRIKNFNNKVLIFTNREFLIVDDTGISKRVKTDRDILNMYGEDRPIVEFRNGFIIY